MDELYIYQALYNPMTEESAFLTLSIHKTEQGARDALAKYIRELHEEHNSFYNYDVDDLPYKFGEFQACRVEKTQVLD